MSIYFKKLTELRKLVKFHGGLKGAYFTIYKTDALKFGEHKGTDSAGNRYYENKSYFIGRSRWVEFTDAVGTDYDGSQITPEWRLWLQYTREESPVEKPAIKRSWTIEHIDNKTGTPQEYVPYSTVKPKIEAWQPPSK